jgi:hypothetical protein
MIVTVFDFENAGTHTEYILRTPYIDRKFALIDKNYLVTYYVVVYPAHKMRNRILIFLLFSQSNRNNICPIASTG